MCDLCVVQHEYGVKQRGRIRARDLLRRESHPYDLLARTRRQVEAVSHVAPSSHFHPFDTGLRAYSGQAVDLQEVTSEFACAGHPPAWLRAGADRPGIRVAEYCLVISQWYLPLWPRGDLSACPHRQIDSAPRSCCGLREKTPLNFPHLTPFLGSCRLS